MGILDFLANGGGSSGGAGALYGDLLTPQQQSAVQQRGLLGFLAGMAPYMGASWLPVSTGQILAAGAGGMGNAQDSAIMNALKARLYGTEATGKDIENQLASLNLQGWRRAQGSLPAPSQSTATPAAPSDTSAAGNAAPTGGLLPGGAVPSASRGAAVMSPEQVRQLATDAGFQGDAADAITGIVGAESGGNPAAVGDRDKGGSYGLTQINGNAWGPVAQTAYNDPRQAMKLAYNISKGGTDFSPWTTYRNGTYRQFLPQSGAGATGAPAGGLLAAAASPTAAPASPAPAASAAPPGGGLLAQAGGAAQPMPPLLTPPARGTPPAPAGAAPGAGIFSVPDLVQQYNLYRSFPAGQAAATSILGVLQKMAPEGFRLNPDGSVALAPGYAEGQGAIEGAKKWAGVGPEIYTKWNIPETVRPGSGVMVGGNLVGAMPQIEKFTDPTTGQETYRYVSPMMGNAAAPGGPGGSAPSGGTAMPGNSADLGVAALGPGQRTALETRAKAEQDQRQKVIDEANLAQQSRATVMNMANEAGNFVQGPFASHAQEAARYLRLIDPSYNGQVASYEDFVKNAGALTRQAVKEVSSRAAVQEFNLISSTLPNPEMSPIGMRRVQNELIGLSDYRIAKSQAQQQWEQTHGGIGNVSGFETAFQKQVSPYAFILARMDPVDRKELFAKLQGSAEGQRELSRVGEQLTFLKQSGLAQ